MKMRRLIKVYIVYNSWVITLVVICLCVKTESHRKKEIPNKALLQEIWKFRKALYTCTNEFNYGCHYNVSEGSKAEFKCIHLDRRCDGYVDCPSGDDETDCPEQPCGKNEVCCVGGGCGTVCDGSVQCVNETDELSCAPPVPSECPGEMECPSGTCATVCDHKIECDEKPRGDCVEDERDCRYVCNDGEVVCNTNRECGGFCDGDVECPDGYDESQCLIECDSDEVSCELEGSSDKGCAELCVGELQCEDAWDESNAFCGSCLDCGTTITPGVCTKTIGCT